MSFVIYNKESTRILKRRNGARTYADLSSAKAGLTRAVNAGKVNRDDYAIAEASEFYTHIEKQETKRNLLSGQEFTQPVNTPLCCDPSSETYWSM
jgi:hypothetical protein